MKSKKIPNELNLLNLIIKNSPEHYDYTLLKQKMGKLKKYLKNRVLNNNIEKQYYKYNILYGYKSNNIITTYSPKLRPNSSSVDNKSKNFISSNNSFIEKNEIFNEDQIQLLFQKKCKDLNVPVKIDLFNRFNDYIKQKCSNRIIDFSECNISLNSINALCSILYNSNICSRLILRKNNLGDKGVKNLMKILKDNTSIVYLDLSSNNIGILGGDEIFKMLIDNISIININLSSVEGINRNRICSEGVKNIEYTLKYNKFLEEINLSSNSLKNDGLKYIINGLNKNNILKNLNISNNEINEKGMTYFKNLQYCKLITLNISNNSIKNFGLDILSKCLISDSLNNLKTLILTNCNLNFEGIKNFFRNIDLNHSINTLILNNNNLSEGNFSDLEIYLKNMNLKEIGLGSCNLSKNMEELSSIIINSNTLKKVDLSHNSIDDDNFIFFINLPKSNSILKHIDFSKNFITDFSCVHFIQGLISNRTLKTINFYDNQLNNNSANNLINIFKYNKTLTNINLDSNRIQIRLMNEIKVFIKRNNNLLKQKLIPIVKQNILNLQFEPSLINSISKRIKDCEEEKENLIEKVKEDSIRFNKQKEIELNNLNKCIEENKIIEKEIEKIDEQKIDIENQINDNNKENLIKINEMKSKINEINNENKKIKEKNKKLQIDLDNMKNDLNDIIIKTKLQLKLEKDNYELSIIKLNNLRNDLENKMNELIELKNFKFDIKKTKTLYKNDSNNFGTKNSNEINKRKKNNNNNHKNNESIENSLKNSKIIQKPSLNKQKSSKSIKNKSTSKKKLKKK